MWMGQIGFKFNSSVDIGISELLTEVSWLTDCLKGLRTPEQMWAKHCRVHSWFCAASDSAESIEAAIRCGEKCHFRIARFYDSQCRGCNMCSNQMPMMW